MTITDFTQKALDQFTERLTDQVFLFIEQDRQLMSDYLHTVQGQELKVVNSQIAKAIKRHFQLETKGQPCEEPKSKLIQGFETFVK